MKILHVGNPEAFKNFAICDYFLQGGHEIHYFSPKPLNTRHPGIVYHHNPGIDSSKTGILQNILFLRRTIKTVKPDLVHAHNVNTYGWMAALAGAQPLIVHAYGGDVLRDQMRGQKKYHYYLSRHTVKKADRVVVTGRHMVQSVAGHFKVDASKIKVISRGVDLKVFTRLDDASKKRLRDAYQVPENTVVLLSPRYLFNSVYNIDVILKAVSLVKADHPDVLLLQMYKHDTEDQAYKDTIGQIQALGLQDCVRLQPMVSNQKMSEIYNLSDICISVPYSDGFPVTVLEASACGVPMIVSDLAYTSEWFKHGENGLVVAPGGVDALANALKDLIGNQAKGKRFAEINLELVRQNADYHACMRMIEELYLEVLPT